MSLAADLTALLADAADLGLADAATYTPLAGSPVELTVTCRDDPQADFSDVGGRIRRRQAVALLEGLAVAAPVQGDRLEIAMGDFVGSWIVVGVGQRDQAGQLVTLRFDDAVRAEVGGIVRDPNV